MKRIAITALTLIFFNSILFGQNESISLNMDIDKNEVWLTKLKSQTIHDQWKNISQRFFEFDEIVNPEDNFNLVHPVLTVDGIPLLTSELSVQSRHSLQNLLTVESIGTILVMDKEPDGLYSNKAFTGIVVVTLNNKKISKKFQKLKLE